MVLFSIAVAALVVASIAFDRTESSVSPAVVPSSIYTVTLPSTLTPTSIPHCFWIGDSATRAPGEIQGLVTIFRAPGAENVSQPSSGACHAPIAEGARWKTTENYLLDTSNDNGLTDTFVAAVFQNAFNLWNGCAGFEIFGVRASGTIDGADFSAPDGKNEHFFATITDSGVIAFTVTWGIFSGPIGDRVLVEHDAVYDRTDFLWGDVNVCPTCMDLPSLVQHETGHSSGLTDIFASGCELVTMYGFSSEGETDKRSLETDDVDGIQELYGGSGSCPVTPPNPPPSSPPPPPPPPPPPSPASTTHASFILAAVAAGGVVLLQ